LCRDKKKKRSQRTVNAAEETLGAKKKYTTLPSSSAQTYKVPEESEILKLLGNSSHLNINLINYGTNNPTSLDLPDSKNQKLLTETP